MGGREREGEGEEEGDGELFSSAILAWLVNCLFFLFGGREKRLGLEEEDKHKTIFERNPSSGRALPWTIGSFPVPVPKNIPMEGSKGGLDD